jgi:hypothetical protein
VATALTVDLVVLVPLAYYVLMVRGQGWPVATTGIVVIASLYGAHALLPSAHDGLATLLTYLIIPVELGLSGYVLYGVVRTVRMVCSAGHDAAGRADVLDQLRDRLREKMGVRVAADAVAGELAAIYFALATWRQSPPASPGTFSYHRSSGYRPIFAAILIAGGVELVAGHILLSLWSPLAAWIHTALGAYALLWLVGDYRAMALRPAEHTGTGLILRCGLRWTVTIPFSDIDAVVPVSRADERREDFLSLSPGRRPDLVLRLRTPTVLDGPYGIRKEAQFIGLALDEPARFLNALPPALTRN